MGSRFSKRVTIFPGFRINFGKKGVSATVGPRGLSLGIGRQGVFGNVGLRGTGLSYREKLVGGNNQKNANNSPSDDASNELHLSIDDNFNLCYMNGFGEQLTPTEERRARKNCRNDILYFLNDYAENFNQELQLSINQHLMTPKPEDDLFQIADFDTPKPAEPRFKKKGFFSRLFMLDKYIDKKNAALKKEYESKLTVWERLHQEFLLQKKDYLEQLFKAQTGDIQAIEKTFKNLMREIKWEKETLIAFDVRKDGTELLIDIDLPEIEDIPSQEAQVVERGLNLKIKSKSAKETKVDYQKSVFAILFRVTGLAFAALPTVEKVVLSGYTQRADKMTGHINDDYIVSVRVDRDKWEKLNFDALHDIEPVLAFENFELICNLNKNGDFATVEPFL